MPDATLLTPTGLQPLDDPETARRFTLSATSEGRFLSASQCLEWMAERRDAWGFEVEHIPFDKMEGWGFTSPGGNLNHRSGRFFSVEGLRVRGYPGLVAEWTQPIIVQFEIGILGILVKEFDGVLHCLMQAKMEPGNSNVVQLSPTVQATRSNYLRIHQGRSTPYLEYFLAPPRGRVLADSLQTEQSGWFLRKRNRNIVVEVREDIEVLEDYCWLTIGQIQQLLRIDNVVNMDARSVLSCMPFAGADSDAGEAGGAAYRDALFASMRPRAGGLHSTTEVISWLTATKAGCDLTQQLIPLRDVADWRHTDDEIAHVGGEFFRVVAVDVRAASREVARWTQPLIAPVAPGLLVLLTRRVGGVLHLLVQARAAPGALDMVEIAPTVHCVPHTYRDVDRARWPRFLDHVARAGPEQVRYHAWLSEEGGRFLAAKNRYLVLETDDDFGLDENDNYCWVTVSQLMLLLRAGNCLNVEARTLLSGLQTWIGR
jgi:dTDP-4-dehydro-6-deoxy-alpha-D-glucopyranose 2,3-dehydratase